MQMLISPSRYELSKLNPELRASGRILDTSVPLAVTKQFEHCYQANVQTDMSQMTPAVFLHTSP